MNKIPIELLIKPRQEVFEAGQEAECLWWKERVRLSIFGMKLVLKNPGKYAKEYKVTIREINFLVEGAIQALSFLLENAKEHESSFASLTTVKRNKERDKK